MRKPLIHAASLALTISLIGSRCEGIPAGLPSPNPSTSPTAVYDHAPTLMMQEPDLCKDTVLVKYDYETPTRILLRVQPATSNIDDIQEVSLKDPNVLLQDGEDFEFDSSVRLRITTTGNYDTASIDIHASTDPSDKSGMYVSLGDWRYVISTSKATNECTPATHPTPTPTPDLLATPNPFPCTNHHRCMRRPVRWAN